jgi:hypothetical protein
VVTATEPATPPVLVATAEPAGAPADQAADPVPRPSFSIAEPAAPDPSEQTLDSAPLAVAFAEFTLPPGEPARPASGAVDITTIDPPREKPVEAAPKPPAHPRRYWVQVATGRDLAALGFDWRRIKRTGGELLSARDAFTAKWGQTNRLVTGPYPNAAAAQRAVTELKEKGLDSFTFTSAEGEAVSPLR